ncbi:GDSL esterase/lipase EXL1-like [Triticum dicoccoides]|uniref:GDSL esterase/lipase EXL1-like n=1 Tax=Triticum dicoccoides TaxID=85692 RepID=UPI0018914544|nr:GDSL esterase/lipase EXL1-like [Triticum dicoccoides]
MVSLYRGLLLVLMALLPSAHGAAAMARSKISAAFMFGDSIVDPGNNNDRLTEAKANFPPYGQDFPGGVATGRFSNGKVPGDMLVSRLGIKELLPPYLGNDLPLSELLTGVVFASGGSGYDPLTSIPSAATSSTGQLELFLEYKERLRALVGEEEMTRVISEGIYFTVMGANDLANNYFTIPLRRHQYDLPSYVKFLVSSAVNFTMKLNEMGAKKIALIGIAPIGCCPSQRELGSRECEPMRNQAANLFNSEIEKEIQRLDAEQNVQGSKFIYLDIYYNLLDLIQRSDFYGFKEVNEGCCGSTMLNVAIFIKNHPACPNAYDFIFWDSFHPTEKAYNIVVDKLFQQKMQYLM